MLFCILFLIIISLVLQLPAKQWRNPWMAGTFIVFSIILMYHNFMDGLLVVIWYLFLISDYGRMLKSMTNKESYDNACNINLVNTSQAANWSAQVQEEDPRKKGWDSLYNSYNGVVGKAIFDPELQQEVQTVFAAQYPPQYQYNQNTDAFIGV